MSTGRFHIVFDGPAFDEHEMNVRDLAPALLAVSDIFDEINRITFDSRYKVGINVRASFKTGSFLTELGAHATEIIDFFKYNETAGAVANMMSIFGIPGVAPVGYSLLKFIRWVRRRKITRVVELAGGKVRVEIDGDAVEVERAIIELFKSQKLRKAFEDLIANTLRKNGIDTVGFGDAEAKTFISIPREEGPSFIADEPEDEPIGTSTRRAHLQLISPCFQEGNKWRFSDGSVSFHAEIRDMIFLGKVMRGEAAFAKGDILDVEMTETQALTAKGLSTERFIEHVYGQRNPIRQYRLPSLDD